MNHVLAVTSVLANEGGVSDPVLLTAALLHDTVEDTDTSYEELRARYGDDVCDVVAEVTDDKTLSKERRKELQVEHAPHLSARAKQLKLADKISNLRDIANDSPADWSEQRKREYADWACNVIAGCRGVNDELERLFDRTVAETRARLEQSAS